MVQRYGKYDPMVLDRIGNYYCRHLEAMTAESLHDKSDIAIELGGRDMEIEALRDMCDELASELNICRMCKHAGNLCLNCPNYGSIDKYEKFIKEQGEYNEK